MPSVAIVGAGITGLTAAYRLQKKASVQVFEAQGQPGGVIQTNQTNGYLVEQGPNTVKGGARILEEVVQELDLANKRVYPGDTAKKRFVVKNGELVSVPLSPWAFLTTKLFSAGAKLRLLKEPFVASAPETPQESLASFVKRRFGQEFVDYGVNPFIAGVFAGDPENLSVAHVFPRLKELERAHGSVLRGAIFGRSRSNKPSSKTDRRIFTFRKGLQTLPQALYQEVRQSARLNTVVTGLTQRANQWHLHYRSNQKKHTETFDQVLLTLPLHQLVALNPLPSPVNLKPLQTVPYPPISVLSLAFKREDVHHPLDGFGVLIPQKEPFDILGTLFPSSLAPGRAPADQVLLTTYVGGMRAPAKARLSTSALLDLVQHDLDALLGLSGSPTFHRHTFWPKAIPQYTLDYAKVLQTIQALEENHPGLHITGNFRNGISVGDAMTAGAKAAENILAKH